MASELPRLSPPPAPPLGFGGWAPGDAARAAPSAPAMDDGVSSIRRRVSVRKRNRPSLETLFAAPAAAELRMGDEQEEEEEEETVAGSPRRKTVGAQPVEVQPLSAQVPLSSSRHCPPWGSDTDPGSSCAHPPTGGRL